MRGADVRAVLAPRSGFVNREFAIQHRLSPVTGGVLGVFLGAVAGGLARPGSVKFAIGGGVLGGALGYGLLASKVSKQDPPIDQAPEESGSADVGGASSASFADAGFAEPGYIDVDGEPVATRPGTHAAPAKITNTGKLSKAGRPMPKKKRTVAFSPLGF